MNQLIDNLINGKLDVEIDSSYYYGDWKKISEGLNSLLKTVKAPISETCLVLEQVSSGNFNASIQGDYKGIFAQMKTAVNKTVENSDIYIKDISEILVKLANQDLGINVRREYVGDHAVIKKALMQIVETLNRRIGEFELSAKEVSIGAKQLSESSMILSKGAMEVKCGSRSSKSRFIRKRVFCSSGRSWKPRQ